MNLVLSKTTHTLYVPTTCFEAAITFLFLSSISEIHVEAFKTLRIRAYVVFQYRMPIHVSDHNSTDNHGKHLVYQTTTRSFKFHIDPQDSEQKGKVFDAEHEREPL